MLATQLENYTILVLEDDPLIAESLVDGLVVAGANIAGPFSTEEAALHWMQSLSLDAAVVDINFYGRRFFNLADLLVREGIPLVFFTVSHQDDMPTRFSDAPVVQKPAGLQDVVDALRRAMQIQECP